MKCIILWVAIVTGLFLVQPIRFVEAPSFDIVPKTQEYTMLGLTNDYRVSRGLNRLSLDSRLMKSAHAKAGDLCQSGNWAHDSSKGKAFYEFILVAGYNYSSAGENLARRYGTAKEAFIALVNSPEHLANIVGDYKDIGISYNNCDGKNYYVIHYGK